MSTLFSFTTGSASTAVLIVDGVFVGSVELQISIPDTDSGNDHKE